MGIEWSISRTLIPGDSKIDFPWNPFHVTSWNQPSSDETPPEKRNIKRKLPDNCHIIICWSQLAKLIQENMVCSNWGSSVTNLARNTVGIATDIDFHCMCRKTASALANRSDHMLDKSKNDFI
jgi:hypothetical protein